jgi:hypothetical protein
MSLLDNAIQSVKARFKEKKTLGFALPKQAVSNRTPRVQAQIPMFVYGYRSGNIPFHEEARTIAIDSHGGLICMQTAVEPGQRLFVINEANERTQECAVVYADAYMGNVIAVEIEFSTPMSQFWHDLEIGKTFRS